MRRFALVIALTCSAGVLIASQWRHFNELSETPAPTNSIAQHMLQAHNTIRSRLRLPPLTWSPDLTRYAQQWAIRLARENRLYHHLHPTYGENLYLIDGARARPSQVVAAWASERRWFNYRTNSCGGSCGHYTQIIWRDSRQLGCATANSGEVQVWVCEYNPPGNIVGERPY